MTRDLTELNKLEAYLKEHGVRYERKDREARRLPDGTVLCCDWHRIVVHSMDDYCWDAICHHGSYGAENGLLEIMGDIVNEEAVGDRVEGWLTAADVIERIEAMK